MCKVWKWLPLSKWARFLFISSNKGIYGKFITWFIGFCFERTQQQDIATHCLRQYPFHFWSFCYSKDYASTRWQRHCSHMKRYKSIAQNLCYTRYSGIAAIKIWHKKNTSKWNIQFAHFLLNKKSIQALHGWRRLQESLNALFVILIFHTRIDTQNCR